jgi:putative nucleotidyltransferase with HDIG domain
MAKFKLPKAEPDFQESVLELVRTLSAIIEEKDVTLKRHSERVANNCANFCEKYKLLKTEEFFNMYMAGLLHDLGLVFIPMDVLKYPENQTDDDKVRIRKHPVLGEKILSNLSDFKSILPAIRHHHEAFDGSGYPDGLKGEAIPLSARILCIVNKFDTLMFPFSKKSGLDMDKALAAIKDQTDTQFDGALIDKFVEFIKSTSGESEDFLLKKEDIGIREIFSQIIEDFKSGKIIPPVMPQVVREVEDVIQQPSSVADDVATVIEKEPVISLRLISIANSPIYRGIQEIRSVKEAIPRMGLKETLNIVIAIAHKSLYETDKVQFRILMDKLWVHVLACAYGSKLIAQHLGLADAEKYFLYGLVHDIGKSLLLKAFTDVSLSKTAKIDVIQANIQQGHLSVGGVLLKRWRFDDVFNKVVTMHEGPEYARETEKEVLVVSLANMLTRTIGFSLFEDEVDFNELDAVHYLGINPDAMPEIGEEVKKIIQDVAHLF